jgi:hypothetical protein
MGDWLRISAGMNLFENTYTLSAENSCLPPHFSSGSAPTFAAAVIQRVPAGECVLDFKRHSPESTFS